MADTLQHTFYGTIADEFLQHYRVGPRFIAVAGVAGSDAATAGDQLAATLRERGQTVDRVSLSSEADADRFRQEVVVPFRARDGILVADGPGLLDQAFGGFWNFSVWIEHDPERDPDWSYVTRGERDPLGAPREIASVLMDDSDPERPRRLFADSC